MLCLQIVSLFHPYLKYSIEYLYGTSLFSTRKDSVLQEKAIRAVYNLLYSEYTNDYFKTNNILKIEDLHNFSLCNYLFRSNASDINSYTSHFLQPLSAFHDCNTRSRSNLVGSGSFRSILVSTFILVPVI